MPRKSMDRQNSEIALDRLARDFKNIDRDISVLRAHAIAGALRKAKPSDPSDVSAYQAWYQCVRQVETVVCSKDGVSISGFHELCGVKL